MESKLSNIKKLVLQILSDGLEHPSNELQQLALAKGLISNKSSSVLRTAIHQLRNAGFDIYSRDRGIYQLRKKTDNALLKGYITLIPDSPKTPSRLSINSEGFIALNGRLNSAIKTRSIEIRISNDAKKIALIPDGDDCHKFTKSGRTKSLECLKFLKNKHFIFPLVYNLEIDSDSGIWFGELNKSTKSVGMK